jgi:hypothetical protein
MLERISIFLESVFSRTIQFFSENYFPLLNELYECCFDGKPQNIELIENELFQFFNEQHCQLFLFLKNVYQNPLFLSTAQSLKE